MRKARRYLPSPALVPENVPRLSILFGRAQKLTRLSLPHFKPEDCKAGTGGKTALVGLIIAQEIMIKIII
jgi:hypothetical protein